MFIKHLFCHLIEFVKSLRMKKGTGRIGESILDIVNQDVTTKMVLLLLEYMYCLCGTEIEGRKKKIK